MKNKKWIKPELVVLVRGDSGESVLVTCKLPLSSGPLMAFPDCYAPLGLPPTSGCLSCLNLTAT
jgi:hypothetical protein